MHLYLQWQQWKISQSGTKSNIGQWSRDLVAYSVWSYEKCFIHLYEEKKRWHLIYKQQKDESPASFHCGHSAHKVTTHLKMNYFMMPRRIKRSTAVEVQSICWWDGPVPLIDPQLSPLGHLQPSTSYMCEKTVVIGVKGSEKISKTLPLVVPHCSGFLWIFKAKHSRHVSTIILYNINKITSFL